MTVAAKSGWISPSLERAGAAHAFELKFLVDERTARAIEDWANGRRLILDPHGEEELDGGYRTTSIYSDTPALDVLQRAPGYRRSKFRVRRYGNTGWAFLERKSKSGDKVRKRRQQVPVAELARLDDQPVLADWPGRWFHERLQEKQLGPACRVDYVRVAYVGQTSEGPLRLTIDQAREVVDA